MLRVSVIVATYNEEKTILAMLREVRAQSVSNVEFEVIVVDDGSRDRTVAMLEENLDLCDKLVKRTKNGGKGAAVLDGLRVATGDYILFQDADLEYSPKEYSDLLFPVTAFGAELVFGSRFIAPKYSRVQYFTHMVGNKIITLLLNVMFNTTFTDIYSCYLLYRRDLVDIDKIVSMGWEQHAEIVCRAVRRAKVMYEVPISYHGRSYEEGKKIRAHHIIAVLAMIIRRRIVA